MNSPESSKKLKLFFSKFSMKSWEIFKGSLFSIDIGTTKFEVIICFKSKLFKFVWLILSKNLNTVFWLSFIYSEILSISSLVKE